jgi:tetratricopeptide (TPR) repeat protein
MVLLTLNLKASYACRAAQQGKPSIADEVEKKPKSDAAKKRPAEPRQPRRRNPVAAHPAMLDVTFTTGIAGAELSARAPGGKSQRLGATSTDGRLLTKMARGPYDITVSRSGYQSSHQQIDVQTGSTTFTLNMMGQPSPNSNANGNAFGASADDVFKRYLDPKQTDQVTANDWQFAQSQTSIAAAQNPGDARLVAQSLFAQGQVAYLRGDYAAALSAFNNSARSLPNSGLAYYGLGNAYLAINQLNESLQAYQRAVELSGGMAMAYKGIGDVLQRQGRSKEAVKYYSQARLMGYVSNRVGLSTAQNLMKLKRWSEALRELQEISKKEPTANVFIYIGDCYVELDQPLSAAPAYRKAMELNQKSALAHAKYGEVMYNSREYAAAVEAFERALALDPSGQNINRVRLRKLANQAAGKVRNNK